MTRLYSRVGLYTWFLVSIFYSYKKKKALRVITFSKPIDHCRPLFIAENILTVINKYILACLVFYQRKV